VPGLLARGLLGARHEEHRRRGDDDRLN